MNNPIGIVGGSGIALRSLLDETDEECAFAEVAGLEMGAVPGHEHRFIFGRCGSQPVILQSGRVHFYEGFDFATVTAAVAAMRSWGVRTIVFTCAAGGLAPGMLPGDLLGVDQVRLWRYRRWDATPGVLLTDILIPGCDFSGAYQWVHGPCYETRAEISVLQRQRACAVGMSIGPEVARCQDLGMRAAVVACITNNCCRPAALTHEEVVATAFKSSSKIARLLRNALPSLAESVPPLN